MAKVTVDRNILIVSILVISLICCALSAGISTYVVNSGLNPITGEKGDKGDTGQTGVTGATGATGATGGKGATGATGSTGVAGTNGQNGKDGAAWHTGIGAPSTSLGVNGDYYLDTATNDLYQKVSGSWVKKTNLHINGKADYDSNWVDIRSLAGQNKTFAHNLNTTDLKVQIEGMDASGNIHQKYLGLDSSTVLGWNQTYGEASNYVALSMQGTGDGGYIITGASIESMLVETGDVFLLKLDSYGDAEWSQVFDMGYLGIGYGVTETSDGGYAVTGVIFSYVTETYNAFLIKTDSTGTLQWNQTFGDTYAVGYSIIQTSDGGYAITGENDDGTEYRMWVAKTYSNGTLQWSNTYDGDVGHAILQTSDGGYTVAGSITNLTSWDSLVCLVKANADGVMQWNKTYGLANNDLYGYSLIGTSDGGYAIAGRIYEDSGQDSVYLVKTTADGTLLWNHTYRGTGAQYGCSVVEALDGGYVIGGYADSLSDDYDMLLLKTYANGTLDWKQSYSHEGSEMASTVVAISDGGYALVGYSFFGDSEFYTIFFAMTTSDGTLDWSQTFGGPSPDYGYSVIATSDGGFAIAGYSNQALTSHSSVYLVKACGDGTIAWTQTYDSSVSSRGYSLIQTSDGGYAITGYSNYDVLLLKTTSDGTMQWSKTFNLGGDEAYGYAVRQTPDGGYVVAGYIYIEVNSTYSSDVFLLKTDVNGTLQWNQTYGGPDDEYAYSMVVTSDGGYAIAGYVESETTYNDDILLIKTYPNGTMHWSQIYSSIDDECGYSLVATYDGGYAIAGVIYSYSTYAVDVFLLKTDADGTATWNQTYGGAGYDYGYSLIASVDGGYVIAGYTRSSPTHSYDVLIVKASANGTLEWTKTHGGTDAERARSIAATADGGYVVTGYSHSPTNSYDVFLIKTEINIEQGLARVSTTNNTITVYRGEDDRYWEYVRIQIWRAD